MGRAKLSMELIKNEKSRSATFQKRMIGLKKKCHELSTLCGVNVGMIVYAPKKDGEPGEPDIWPPRRHDIVDLINKYRSKPNEDRKKRTICLSDFFEDRKEKAENTLMKLRKINEEAKYPTWDTLYETLSTGQLQEVKSFLESKIEAVNTKLECMKSKEACLSLNLQHEPYNFMHSNLFGSSSMDLEIVHQQPMCPFNTLDHFNQAQQGLDLRMNAMANPTMMMNNNNYNQPRNASSDNYLYAPLNGPVCYDPMLESTSIAPNNQPSPAPQVCYYGTAVHEQTAYQYLPVQSHTSQINEYYEITNFLLNFRSVIIWLKALKRSCIDHKEVPPPLLIRPP
ncbi:hypothetical protein RJ640_030708 [Escallonia rubra]|uniref:MADS-box domain-containing protein n=1 Tax=Escallonia rubra TaxID=112253 RepID=A0AA88QFB8_9ASTE|nr:hypothetical protein RJ640_030708 [Escallonia rubra]